MRFVCLVSLCALGALGGFFDRSPKADEVVKVFEKGILSEDAPVKEDKFASVTTGLTFTVTPKVLHGGKQEGTLVLEIVTPKLTMVVSPSRGMNIMSAEATDATPAIHLGWKTPIQEIINPVYINQLARGGSGFLDGFSETVARCGFEWVGHAGEDEGEMLSLHGLNAATPASEVSITAKDNTLTITGLMYQVATKKVAFTIVSNLHIDLTKPSWSIEDVLVNSMGYPHEFQVLYHSNFGSPILEEGSKIYIPAREVSPFNEAAVSELESWDTFRGPTRDYDETVYNIYVYSDENKRSLSLMTNKDGTVGIQVGWDTTHMPVFGLWKNTDLESLGYVAGLEPGSGFSYNRKFNRELGLVEEIDGGPITFKVDYSLLRGTEAVDASKKAISDIQGDQATSLHGQPLSREGATDPEETTAPADGVPALLVLSISAATFIAAAF